MASIVNNFLASNASFLSTLMPESFAAFAEGRYAYTAVFVVISLLLLGLRGMSPEMDPREPPLYKPRIPVIGHIIGIMTEHTAMFKRLYKENPLPIYTLPLASKKMYVINNPSLISPALRSKTMSFEPFVLEFTPKMLDLRPETADRILHHVDDKGQSVFDAVVQAVHTSMLADSLRMMNQSVLGHVADSLNQLDTTGSGLELDNFWLWIRDLMTMATTDTLYGKHNPWRSDPSLVETLWTFDGSVSALMLRPFPSLTARTGFATRRAIQQALVGYYGAGHDADPTPQSHGGPAAITRVRGQIWRRHGFSPEETGQIELTLVHVATTNAVPTLFWALVWVLGDVREGAGVRDRVRSEVDALVKWGDEFDEDAGGSGGGKKKKKRTTTRVATLDLAEVEKKAPFAVACYHEAMRLASWSPAVRRVMADTVLAVAADDASSASSQRPREYLLKAGVDVQMAIAVSHRDGATWGADAGRAEEFDPANFYVPPGSTEQGGAADDKQKAAAERARRNAFTPFGGGRHLCPGRRFALAENLAVICAMAAGFEAEGTTGGEEEGGRGGRGIRVPEMKAVMMGEGVAKPVKNGEGVSVRLKRREGWEDVKWRFTC